MKTPTDAVHAFQTNVPWTTRWTTRPASPGRCSTHRWRNTPLATVLLMATAIAAGWIPPANANPSVTTDPLMTMEIRTLEGVLDRHSASVRLRIASMDARRDRTSKPPMIDGADGGMIEDLVSWFVFAHDDSGYEDRGAWLSLSFDPETPRRDFDAVFPRDFDTLPATNPREHRPRRGSGSRTELDGLAIEAGYGTLAFSGRFSSMLYAGLSASGDTMFGWRIAPVRHGFDFAVAVTRDESAGAADHHLGISLRMGW